MFKGIGVAEDRKTPVVLLGLTLENIKRLTQGNPIMVDLTDLGMPPMRVFITYGEDERAIAQSLEDDALLPPGTAANMPEVEPGQSFRYRKRNRG